MIDRKALFYVAFSVVVSSSFWIALLIHYDLEANRMYHQNVKRVFAQYVDAYERAKSESR